MCLAEALLRIPDAETVDKLIRDKIAAADWERHLGHSGSLFVNASTWALMLTGRLLRHDRIGPGEGDLGAVLRRFVARSSEPVWRQAVTAAMRILAGQFIMGRTIDEALERAREAERQGYRHSFDMLGEAARTMPDAVRYREAYEGAIGAIGQAAGGRRIEEAPGISVKLSALHPRYEMAQRERVMHELLPSLLGLARQARDAGIGFTIDAEEADRLELSLDLVEALALAPELAGWDGLGLAVQAYQKRALPLLDWLADLALRARRRLMVRLVKGAYWDTEIKRAQERGLDTYPVFTRKVATDVCYLACAKRLFAAGPAFYPQFATHNAHTVAAILEMGGDRTRLGIPAAARHGRGALCRNRRPRTSWAGRAGCTPRSAATKICLPIWCGGCSRTAPTRLLSTGSSMSANRSTRSSPIRSRGSRACRTSRIRPFRCRATSSSRRGATRRGIDLADPRSLSELRERPRGGGAPAVDRRRRSSAASS